MVNGGSYGVTIRGMNIGGVESHPINNANTMYLPSLFFLAWGQE
jgi:hypothetical protein